MKYTKKVENRLATPLVRWMNKHGWKSLRSIQQDAVSAVLDSTEDILICAATASGKTEAAFLPILSQVIHNQKAQHQPASGFDVIYIAPLKALINDQWRRVQDMCHYAGIAVTPWHGDIASSIKNKAKDHPRGVLLITPESLEALFVNVGFMIPELFQNTSSIIIDEWHSFLGNVRGVHLRSLLSRLDIATHRRHRRIGLSATLGDLTLACRYMCPESPESVRVICDNTRSVSSSEVFLETHIYHPKSPKETNKKKNSIKQYEITIARSLFQRLRATKSLIFVTSRYDAELYAYLLKKRCERRKMDNEFFPHHGCLSKQHREEIEQAIKSSHKPKTIVSTSTLELGIDIGNIMHVAQVGCARSVSSLRQRMGRSGRSKLQPSRLWCYEYVKADPDSCNISDYLYLHFMVSVALIELLKQGKYEPPPPLHALNLSTLIHQIISMICQYRTVTEKKLYSVLCHRSSPFSHISRELFSSLIKQLSHKEALICKFDQQKYVLSNQGEKISSFYTFYAAFKTPIHYEIKENGMVIGTIAKPKDVEQFMVYGGKNLMVHQVDKTSKTIQVQSTQQSQGMPPRVSGDGVADIHDMVLAQVESLFLSEKMPDGICKNSQEILQSARANFKTLGLDQRAVVEITHSDSSQQWVIGTWSGSVLNLSLSIWLRHFGYKVTHSYPGVLLVTSNAQTAFMTNVMRILDAALSLPVSKIPTYVLYTAIHHISVSNSVPANILRDQKYFFIEEKYHRYLDYELLDQDFMSSQLNMQDVPKIARKILQKDLPYLSSAVSFENIMSMLYNNTVA